MLFFSSNGDPPLHPRFNWDARAVARRQPSRSSSSPQPPRIPPSTRSSAPLLSRSTHLTPPTRRSPTSLDAAARGRPGVEAADFVLADEARDHLVTQAVAMPGVPSRHWAAAGWRDGIPGAEPERPVTITSPTPGRPSPTPRFPIRPGGDRRYDVASALIRSCGVDAALHLARMLGRGPRFIARRIVIAASEDVGMGPDDRPRAAVASIVRTVAQIRMPRRGL